MLRLSFVFEVAFQEVFDLWFGQVKFGDIHEEKLQPRHSGWS
jgi:hypothetical protein